MIFHRHHPHSFRMRSTHPVTRLFHSRILSYYPISYNSLFLFIKYLFMSYAQSYIRHDKNFFLFVTYVLVTCQLPTYFHIFLYCFMTIRNIKEPLKILHFQGFWQFSYKVLYYRLQNFEALILLDSWNVVLQTRYKRRTSHCSSPHLWIIKVGDGSRKCVSPSFSLNIIQTRQVQRYY